MFEIISNFIAPHTPIMCTIIPMINNLFKLPGGTTNREKKETKDVVARTHQWTASVRCGRLLCRNLSISSLRRHYSLFRWTQISVPPPTHNPLFLPSSNYSWVVWASPSISVQAKAFICQDSILNSSRWVSEWEERDWLPTRKKLSFCSFLCFGKIFGRCGAERWAEQTCDLC